MRISECICNRMKRKYRFFDPFTGEAPFKSQAFRCLSFLVKFFENILKTTLKLVLGSGVTLHGTKKVEYA